MGEIRSVNRAQQSNLHKNSTKMIHIIQTLTLSIHTIGMQEWTMVSTPELVRINYNFKINVSSIQGYMDIHTFCLLTFSVLKYNLSLIL